MAPGTSYAIVPASINGQAASMLLDTGDEGLTVTPRARLALGLSEDQRHRTTVHGIGGDLVSFNAELEHLELGGYEMLQTSASVAEMPILPPVKPPLAGVIGADVMSSYDMEFDFHGRRVGLWQRTGCASASPVGQGPYATLRLLRTSGSLVTLDVSVNGLILRALLDTGAASTTLNVGAASRLALPAASAGDKTYYSRGADGSDVVTHRALVAALAAGGLVNNAMPVLVGPVHVPFADMMLGVDFLQGRRLWISYENRVAFIQ